MSVVDLNSRITDDWKKFNDYKKSSSSYIHIKGPIYLDESGPAAIDISVGDSYYDYKRNAEYKIPAAGLKLLPGKSALITAEQKISLPLNVFGLVSGKGKLNFKGCFISVGKINPGYEGNLKIGLYNGNTKVIIIKPRDVLACCSFFNVETYMKSPLEDYQKAPEPTVVNQGIGAAIIWLKENWYSVVSLVVAIASFIVAFLALTKK